MRTNELSQRLSTGVVIATYNGEMYIKQQLDSILAQTRKPDLIVISDGYSNDNTVLECEKALHGKKIKYKILTSTEQLSVKNNFEKGISHCDTDIIFCADQDDFWLPKKIEKFLDVFRNQNADMVFSNAYITDEFLNRTGKNLWESVGFYPDTEIKVFDKADVCFLNELNRHNVVTGMCMAFRSTFKEQLLPFSENAIHDVWIAYKMNQLGRIVALNSCEVLYRQHNNNAIGTSTSLKSSFHRKKGYYERIVKRKYLIEDLYTHNIDNQLKSTYEKYIKHLNFRIGFIEKKMSLFRGISRINNYMQFEYNWLQIFMKDIYTRWNLRK